MTAAAVAVLDTSALLALLNGEPGADRVAAVIDQALVSSVNLAELITKLVTRGVPSAAARSVLDSFQLEVSDFTRPLAEETGSMVEKTKMRGLSLGDRACLALASAASLPAYTADREWGTLNLPCRVVVIR